MMRLILSLTPAIILIKSITPLGALVIKENQNNILSDGGKYLNSGFSKNNFLMFTDSICSV